MAKNNLDTGAAVPSTDAWLKEAKTDGSAKQCGMYLFHNGVVRETAKAKVRQGADIEEPVVRMEFSYEEEKVREAIAKAYELPGIYYVKELQAPAGWSVDTNIYKIELFHRNVE